ncbi:helix-turn-helix domain-containing protein [Halocola ammonii]
MIIHIKYMVSLRCKMLVREELKKIGLHAVAIDLGRIEIMEDISDGQHQLLKANLMKAGLELLDDHKSILVDKICNVIIEMVHHSEVFPKINFSDYISKKLDYDYTYLSNLFTEVKGTTIQQYIIAHKIEKVKELILYDEFNLTEISYMLHYSSVGHLSNQFKKVTGLSPTFYKKLGIKRKQNLEDVYPDLDIEANVDLKKR